VTNIVLVALLGVTCTIGQHIAHRCYCDDLARMLTFGAAVLFGAAFWAMAVQVAL
jgi:hypothetical protein